MAHIPSIADFMPDGPDWRLDWEAMDEAYPWIRAMRGSTQDPVHHAEGDVWVHTRMVVEELVASAEWRAAPKWDRLVAFAAAVLHDVAKPRTRIEEGGRVTNPRHSSIGARDARVILWRMDFPYALRERVCVIVAAHQLPFHLVERLGTERAWEVDRALASISLTVPNRLLAMVAEADARGRICPDRQRIVDNVDLFREMARDLGCHDGPFPFHNDHTRVRYFAAPERTGPFARIHDDTDPDFTVTLLSGLPGCGKSRWAARETGAGGLCAGQPVLSLDALRAEMGVAPGDNQGTVVQASRERAREFLRQRRSFVWDATNLDLQQRGPATSLAADYGARIRIVYVEAPEPEMFAGNRERAAYVPDDAIQRMLRRWTPPALAECHELLHARRAAAPKPEAPQGHCL